MKNITNYGIVFILIGLSYIFGSYMESLSYKNQAKEKLEVAPDSEITPNGDFLTCCSPDWYTKEGDSIVVVGGRTFYINDNELVIHCPKNNVLCQFTIDSLISGYWRD